MIPALVRFDVGIRLNSEVYFAYTPNSCLPRQPASVRKYN